MPPPADRRARRSEPDEERAARRAEVGRAGARRLRHVDAPVERLELGDHRLEQVAAPGGTARERSARSRTVVTSLSSRIPMARDWTDLFILDGGAPRRRGRRGGRARAAAAASSAACARTCGKTREALGAEVQATLFETLDDETWERLEEALIMADVGAAHDRGGRRASSSRRPTRASVEGGEALTARLDRAARRASPGRGRRHASTCATSPTVIMVAGVNGTGKTTTIGKLAWHLREDARADRRARRRRHVPRRRRRAARGVGASAPAASSSRARRGLRPGRGRLRRGRAAGASAASTS